MKEQGFTESRLQLLSDISGAFRPGVLTALVGVSGAGKTTLMDVLAGRKTSGTIEGDIKLSGYPKKQETFARISGYCEQTDIHSPNVTVYESLVYSAWLRLSSEVDDNTRKVCVFLFFFFSFCILRHYALLLLEKMTVLIVVFEYQ
jgi:ABC-type multidrug transport system ATPase subunit